MHKSVCHSRVVVNIICFSYLYTKLHISSTAQKHHTFSHLHMPQLLILAHYAFSYLQNKSMHFISFILTLLSPTNNIAMSPSKLYSLSHLLINKLNTHLCDKSVQKMQHILVLGFKVNVRNTLFPSIKAMHIAQQVTQHIAHLSTNSSTILYLHSLSYTLT